MTGSRPGREARDLADLVTDGLFYALPARVALAPAAMPQVALVIGYDWLRAATIDAAATVRLDSASLSLDAAADLIAGTLRAHGADVVGPIALLLDDESCLTHQLRLPPAPTRLIDALVANLAAERSPFGDGGALCAWALRGRDRDGLSVEAVALDRSLVEPLLGRLWSAGLAVGAVGRLRPDAERVDWLSPPAWAGLAAPSPWSALGGLLRPLRLVGLFLALVLAAALLNVAYAMSAHGRLSDEAERGLATARSRAVLRSDHERLDAARGGGASRILLLDEIAARLPDDAWLEAVKIGAGEVELSVVAGSASGVLGALASTPGLRGLALRGAVTQDPASRRDRFRLGATVTARDAPRAGDGAP